MPPSSPTNARPFLRRDQDEQLCPMPEALLNTTRLECTNAREELSARTTPRPLSRSASSDSFEMVEAEAPEAADSNSGGGAVDETEQETTGRIARCNHYTKLGDYDRAVELSPARAPRPP